MPRNAYREQILKDAWIGDAVLELYIRLKILREDGITDGEKAQRMTSNSFLSIVAEPSETEAAIGRAYLADGLPAAFAWIEEKLVPHYERREAARVKRPKTSAGA